ncbi:5-bromo-4-chloroindolyl phosphate hydrolysis family protein [Bradyrhizobium iriomotense]|uniref:5-bromo-4-chloroindolyl phosphate hydrolysis family protein n=1 Tax=Bradyrhizobium iriomotense TaxID=441950 RepID=UPI001B8A0584|nr:5-bromo-4-chloroindolyl phosphate hydrolysis family protein [Bradyrhizobium iriomotense]MBR1133541.1 5-bromo-4-chloroindolyl phosphate hydrolysis family protein [Bradyrhizobium iriomotense]
MAATPSGLGWIAGGVAAAALLPSLAIGLGMPFLIALAISAAAGGGIVVALAPRNRFAALEAGGIARGKIEFANELLTEAEPLAERMEDAASAIRTRAVADRIRHLVKVARDIFAAIERDPLRLDRVRRFLTYYLPRAAEIAEAYRTLEKSPVPDTARLAAIGEMIDRLDGAFTRYAANLQDADLDKLDIELKLLKSSLDEDIGPTPPAAPVETKRGTS